MSSDEFTSSSISDPLRGDIGRTGFGERTLGDGLDSVL